MLLQEKTVTVTVIGAGLAGCEAAYQIARRGVKVRLFDLKPDGKTPAHHAETFAELVCSNSLKSESPDTAHGLLKAELRALGSLILSAADRCRVPAGSSLSVDREQFSALVTREIQNNPLIEAVCADAAELPAAPAVIAAGPLASDALLAALRRECGQANLSFYDAAAPIVTEESIDKTVAFPGSRYGKGGADDYWNCPFTKEQYDVFYDALLAAPTALLKSFETPGVFEGCMPVEAMAKRGRDAPRFGPMRPVGFALPGGGRPYAVVQLRREKAAGVLYNLVGFQTNLTFAAQRDVFRKIPGLQNAEFARYGVMHRNAFLNAPLVLDRHSALKARPGVFVAGQLSGVEGYVESAASGLLAGLNAARLAKVLPPVTLGNETILGALTNYIASASPKNFQPMNANFGLLAPLDVKRKEERYRAFYERSTAAVKTFADTEFIGDREWCRIECIARGGAGKTF
jgi:methylenetetrahydrofolate--tRNA-(uracil-5-)-methyltransferase